MSLILVVDDETDIAESLEVALKAQGYEVKTASNGKQALDKAVADKPDVILMDVMMPELNGFEACRNLKNSPETKNIPILLLTALHQTEDKVKGLDAGADDFISKPFNEVELKARLRAFLRTKGLHDELERSFEKLKELEQLRDSLTHMIVHDLKAPLTAVKGGLAALLDFSDETKAIPDAYKKLILNADSSAQRVVDMIQDILDVSRLEEKKLPLQRTEADVPRLLQSCVMMLEPIARGKGVSLKTNNTKSVPSAFMDVSLTQRVLANLISNSLKFTDQGGTIVVSAEFFPNENTLQFSVEDTGIGIPKHMQPRLFEKFFQGTNIEVSRKGQGLGLAFCRLAVEAQGGKIWVESEEGKGSRFVMRFPLSSGFAGDSGLSPGRNAKPELRRDVAPPLPGDPGVAEGEAGSFDNGTPASGRGAP